jgi:hypothetical protein
MGYYSLYSSLLYVGWLGFRTVWSKFSVPVQTGPGAHSASCIVGSGFLFLGVRQLGHGINHPPHPVLMLKKELKGSPAPLLGLHGLYGVNFTFKPVTYLNKIM